MSLTEALCQFKMCTAGTLWSLGKLNIQSPPLLRLLTAQTEKHVGDLQVRAKP